MDFNIKENFLFKESKISKTQAESLVKVKSFQKGEIIYSAENYEKALGIIIKGNAKAYSSTNAELASFSAGETFGGAALFGSEMYLSEIRATRKCEVGFIYEKELKRLFEEYPETAVNYIKYLSSKVRFLNKKIEIYTSNDVASRVYNYLCQTAVSEEIQRPNMSKISEKLKIGRTSLYRAVNELEAKGLIEKQNGKIYVRKN